MATGGSNSFVVTLYTDAACTQVATAQQVIDAAHYNPRAQDSPDSVFCYYGAGVVIPWNEARSHAHCVDELPEGAL